MGKYNSYKSKRLNPEQFIDEYIGNNIEMAKDLIKAHQYFSASERISYVKELYPEIFNLNCTQIGALLAMKRETIQRHKHPCKQVEE